MAKYRKKPVVVEAIHAHRALYAAGHSWKELPKWLADAYEAGTITFANDHVSIKTTEGNMRAEPGDMIIQGTRGEIYPCKPGPFADTFELVDSEPAR